MRIILLSLMLCFSASSLSPSQIYIARALVAATRRVMPTLESVAATRISASATPGLRACAQPARAHSYLAMAHLANHPGLQPQPKSSTPVRLVIGATLLGGGALAYAYGKKQKGKREVQELAALFTNPSLNPQERTERVRNLAGTTYWQEANWYRFLRTLVAKIQEDSILLSTIDWQLVMSLKNGNSKLVPPAIRDLAIVAAEIDRTFTQDARNSMGVLLLQKAAEKKEGVDWNLWSALVILGLSSPTTKQILVDEVIHTLKLYSSDMVLNAILLNEADYEYFVHITPIKHLTHILKTLPCTHPLVKFLHHSTHPNAKVAVAIITRPKANPMALL